MFKKKGLTIANICLVEETVTILLGPQTFLLSLIQDFRTNFILAVEISIENRSFFSKERKESDNPKYWAHHWIIQLQHHTLFFSVFNRHLFYRLKLHLFPENTKNSIMFPKRYLGVVVVCACVLGLVPTLASGSERPRVYMNEFAVHIPEGEDAANSVASKHGFINRGQVSHQFFS